MKDIIMLKLGEIVLKGLNRGNFEQKLNGILRRRLAEYGKFDIYTMQSTVYVEALDDNADTVRAYDACRKVFGAVAITRAAISQKDVSDMARVACEYLGEDLKNVRTFKVESKRADKAFHMKSPEISAELGGRILEKFPHLRVDVKNPQLTVYAEVREKGVYIHKTAEAGAGGMPIGMNGKAALLLSGGIDSPVAGYMIAKRGVELKCIHFYSYPYTSERAKIKVLDLARAMTEYTGDLTVEVVPFTDVQIAIKRAVPEELFTLVMRRFMMRIAERRARMTGCRALVTGESLGQVASQTMEAIAVTENACGIPIFRPVIGMDKEEIVEISRKIGTFPISILPYEDCCTVMTPRHPKTRPTIEEVVEAEKELDVETLVNNAVEGTEIIKIKR